jgi:hypothetical protein
MAALQWAQRWPGHYPIAGAAAGSGQRWTQREWFMADAPVREAPVAPARPGAWCSPRRDNSRMGFPFAPPLFAPPLITVSAGKGDTFNWDTA